MLTTVGLVAAGVGLQGLIRVNMGRINDTADAGPVATLAAGAGLGMFVLAMACRRALLATRTASDHGDTSGAR